MKLIFTFHRLSVVSFILSHFYLTTWLPDLYYGRTEVQQ